MKKNIGAADKIVRIIIALVIIGLYWGNVISGTTAIILLIISGVFILTSLVGFCPLYTLFGISTCRSKK